MLIFDVGKMQEGDLVKCRNEMDGEDFYAKLIRIGVHSYSNHDGMTVLDNGRWAIAEAVEPRSTMTPIHQYQQMMKKNYSVRIYRLKGLSVESRKAMAQYYKDYLIGLPYPKKKKMILLASRLYSILYDNLPGMPALLRLTWCSQLVANAILSQGADLLDGPKGKKKKLWTPKTFENRILQGLFEDVTDEVIIDDDLDGQMSFDVA